MERIAYNRILSISGNQSMNYLLRTVLSEQYEVIAVFDVYQGVLGLKKGKRIDLIIIDIDYQEKESFEFIEHIQTSALYTIPIIVLISTLNEVITGKLAWGYVSDHFVKPFSPADLLKRVNELVFSAPTFKYI
ncbi:MAG TPA: response regulator [Chitinophagaceae bacterium]|jgi:DNA-binding response OmpR family regulator|nr:response regulator [Chitinophagaceae bacterium]